jgi:TonB family protein
VLGWTAPAGTRRIVVGYYRSHASSRFALEDADRYLFERCFPKDVRVALLVKAPKGGAGAGQIYLGDDGQVEADRVTVEFPFSLKQLVAEPPAAPPPMPVAVKRSRSGRFWKMGLTAAAAAASVIGLKGVGLFDRQAAAPVVPLVRPVEAAPAPPEPAPKPRPAAPATKKPPVETRRVASVSPTPVRQLVAEAPSVPVQEYSAPPRAIRQVAPVVREALRQSITGEIVVRVRVQVDSNGRVISAESVTQGRPVADALAATAVAAVKQWEFEPARPGQTILSFAFRR